MRHLQSKCFWPKNDTEFATDKIGLQGEDADGNTNEGEEGNDGYAAAEHDDGIVYDQGYEDDDFLVNTNRVAALKVDDSSDSSDEEG